MKLLDCSGSSSSPAPSTCDADASTQWALAAKSSSALSSTMTASDEVRSSGREQKPTSLYLNEHWLEIVAIWLDDDHTRDGSEATLSRYVGGIRRHRRGVRSEELPPVNKPHAPLRCLPAKHLSASGSSIWELFFWRLSRALWWTHVYQSILRL